MNHIDQYLEHLRCTKGMVRVFDFKLLLESVNSTGMYTNDIACVNKWLQHHA